MRKYCFGPKIIKYFRILYKEISAKIMVNGHLSKKVNIKRGFKKSDTFSNGLFNLSIDPLIRNLIASREIRMVRFITPNSGEEIKMKAGGYAAEACVPELVLNKTR